MSTYTQHVSQDDNQCQLSQRNTNNKWSINLNALIKSHEPLKYIERENITEQITKKYEYNKHNHIKIPKQRDVNFFGNTQCVLYA